MEAKNRNLILATFLFSSLFAFACLHSATAQDVRAEDSEVLAARKARDAASVEELQKIIAAKKKEATETNSFDAYLRIALFHVWLCEAIESSGKNALFKEAAEQGVAAAEKAVTLNPQSSEAHQLLGDLLNQLIPHVLGGGMRYGARATDEIEKALELNPQNVDALVSRAIVYYYTPRNFGGSKPKAFAMLEKAAEIDVKADSPRIWLAFFNLDAKKNQEALKHILAARQINPSRAFTNYVYDQVKAATKKTKRG